MKRIVFSSLTIALILVVGCVSLWAQATAQISGTVKDQSGAVLPGVEVTATQTDTGIARMTVTNETGSYVLSNLPTGPYRLEAALPGFRTFVQTGIQLQVNTNPVINPTLEVGQVSEQVEVQANAAAVETRNVGVGQVMETQRILELPLDGRNLQDLVVAAGGAVSAGAPRAVLGTGQLISVAGGLPYGTDYGLDGANHVSFLIGSTMPMPFPDAAQEFKVESSGLSANRGSSSSVSVVTKSGTNQLHGDLFEFVRNDLFNATSYFAAVNPATGEKKHSTLKRNQFGGTVGGPITKNKLFFFGGYQGTTLRSDAANTQSFIPTPAMMAGDWTAFASPACNNGVQRVLRAPFVQGANTPGGTTYTLPAASQSKVATFIANKVIASQDAPPNACGLVIIGTPTKQDNHMFVGKTDYQMSDKHSLFGRVLFETTDIPRPEALSKNLLNGGSGTDALASSYAFGSTYLVGPNTVQAFRLTVNRWVNKKFTRDSFSVCDAGATDIYCGYAPTSITGWSITGGFAGLGTSSPTGAFWAPTSYAVNDDVTLARGSHQFNFGAGFLHGRMVEVANFQGSGSFTFNGSVTGLGMADFMTGRLATFQQGTPNKADVHDTRMNVFLTDAWKATPRLTVNYGIRWEPFFPQLIPDIGSVPGPVYNFNHDRFIKGVYSTVFVNAPAGFYYTGDPGFPSRTGVHKRWAQFAPRLGFAWDVQGDGRTSVRASYALSYAFIPGNWREDTGGSIPWGGRVILNNPPGGLDAPWRGIAGGNPFPYVLNNNAPFPPAGQYKSDPYDMQTPQTYSWNLSLQRQFGTSWIASASYMGTRALHVWTMDAINPALFLGLGPCALNGVQYPTCSTTANTQERRLYSLERPIDGTKIGSLAEMNDGGRAYYHGLLASLERRLAKGISANANYTWSHCIGPYSYGGQITKLAPDVTGTKPGNRDFDQGTCDSDRRQLFNLTALVDTPQFANHTVRMLATGWKISGIYRFTSGTPLTILAGADRALTGVNQAAQRADQIAASGYKDKSGGPLTQWFDATAFALPALGTYGNVARNSVIGPSRFSLDMAISRSFNVREAQHIEARVEAFNITNTFRPDNPATNISQTNTFGQLRTALDPRVMQFALKYVF
jgi:carboxypeptidase family protein